MTGTDRTASGNLNKDVLSRNLRLEFGRWPLLVLSVFQGSRQNQVRLRHPIPARKNNTNAATLC